MPHHDNDPCVREAMLWAKATGPVAKVLGSPGTEGKAENHATNCFLCAHRCTIMPGKRGICQVRENRDGTLHTLVYGRLIAASIDPIEKKPLFHFLPGTRSYSIATMGCNFKCAFCQNADISQVSATDSPAASASGRRGHYVPPEDVVSDALRGECPSISYTYTEPTIFFEYAHDVAVLAHAHGLKNVFVSNGYQTPETIEKMAGLIDAANIDLKAFTQEFYGRVCKARLAPVLEAIRLMHQKGIFLEITTLLIPGENDSDAELTQIAEFLVSVSPDIPWHVSAFFPTYHMTDKEPTPPESILRALDLGAKAGVKFRYAGNIRGQGFGGRISSSEDTLCPACGKAVVRRSGFSVRDIKVNNDRLARPPCVGCGFCGAHLPMVMQ